MSLKMNRKFLKEVCDEVAEAWIRDDANLLDNLLRGLRAHAPLELWEPNAEIDGTQAVAWWRRRGGLPHHLQWIRNVLEAGEQPVFASISLCVQGSETPTIYLPVPYAMNSYDEMRRLFWPHSPRSASTSKSAHYYRRAQLKDMVRTSWEDLARTLSHALANVSHSMRVGDRPTYGWLAYAHTSSQVVYLQDLTRVAEDAVALENRYQLRNAAMSEEEHVGMASALYIPLWSAQMVKVQVGGREYAQAVLLLWSPVPHRWDHVFECEPESPVLVASDEDNPVRKTLSRRLSWIRGVVSKEMRSQKHTEAQVLALLHGIGVSTADRGSDAARAEDAILHGLGAVLFPIRAKITSSFPLVDWLDFLFQDLNGIRNILETTRRVSLSTVPVIFLEQGRPVSSIVLGDWGQSTAELPWPEVQLALNRDVAAKLGADPADNINKFGKTLSRIEIDRSEKYVTVRYCLVPKYMAKKKIYGTPEGFKRYYAVRRGLPVAPGEVESDRSGYGLGLLLHRVVAGRYRVYRVLYLSADGAECRVEQALPILQHTEEEHAQDIAVRGRCGRRGRARRRAATGGSGARTGG